MTWERRGQQLYYTQTVKHDGRRERVYVGRGPLAQLASQVDLLLLADLAALARARREEQARWQAALEPLEELGRLADLVSRAALLAAGFHERNRGHWRRKRGHQTNARRGPGPA
jgi:hypothetical protein